MDKEASKVAAGRGRARGRGKPAPATQPGDVAGEAALIRDRDGGPVTQGVRRSTRVAGKRQAVPQPEAPVVTVLPAAVESDSEKDGDDVATDRGTVVGTEDGQFDDLSEHVNPDFAMLFGTPKAGVPAQQTERAGQAALATPPARLEKQVVPHNTAIEQPDGTVRGLVNTSLAHKMLVTREQFNTSPTQHAGLLGRPVPPLATGGQFNTSPAHSVLAQGSHTPVTTTRHGVQIELLVGDITRQEVTAIVDPANEVLSAGGGVSWALAAAAGPEYRQECADSVQRYGPIPEKSCRVTGPGYLSALFVIHAVGVRANQCSNVAEMEGFLLDTYLDFQPQPQ